MAKPSTQQTIPIADLTVDPANLRLHDDRNASGIESSLKRFGAGRSVVVDGKGIIRAGNGTVVAARRAGFTEVLVVDPQPGQLVAVRREDWSATEATAYAIADNRLTDQSAFDQTGLAETLRALQSEAFDLDAVGFTADEVDELCKGLADEIVGEDEWADAVGGLPDGEKTPFQSMTFTLADAQAATVTAAIERAKSRGGFQETGNENSNGNALARVCEVYLAVG